MQRTLASQLANQGDLDVISFQHCDCLVFERGEILKMLLPRSKRVLGGTTQDRMVIGELLVIFDKDLERLRPPSKRFKFTNFVIGIPIANFPSLTAFSGIVDGRVDEIFFRKIHDLLNALPVSKSEWSAKFGDDFLEASMVDRCFGAVRYLRERN